MLLRPFVRALALVCLLPGLVLGDEITDRQDELARNPKPERRLDLLLELGGSLSSNDPQTAVRYTEEAIALAEPRGLVPKLAAAMLNLSMVKLRLNDLEGARAAAERARTLYRKLGDRAHESSAVLNLGGVLFTQNRYPEAAAAFRESLALGDEKKDPAGASQGHINLGAAFLMLGDLPGAAEEQQRALAILQRTGNQSGEAETLLNLGVIEYQRGDYPAAVQHYTAALALSEKLGDLRNAAMAAGNLGIVLVDQRRLEDATRYLEQCMALARQTSDRARLASALVTLSVVRQKQGRLPEARAALEEAVVLATELGDQRLLGAVRGNLGDVLLNEQKPAEAVGQLRAAEAAVIAANDATLLGIMRVRLAKAQRLAGEPTAALETLARSIAAAEELKNKRTLVAALTEQGYAGEALGDLTGALRDARRARELDQELLNETTAKQIADAQTRYETEKKTRQIEVLERDQQIQRLDSERQRLVRNGIIAGAVLLFALALAAFQAYRSKRRTAQLLAEKNESLSEANLIISGERAKSERLLLSILPASIADQLKEEAGTIADSHPHATVLFADLVGFTVFSRTVSAEELVRLLDRIFTRFDRLAAELGVEKIKTIGDCYMVVAGLPAPAAEHCEQIAQMALGMLAEIRAFNAEAGQQIQLRIGFHTGPVVAGVIGRQKFIYDLWGDTVNTASRMESSGVPGRIHVSETVALALRGEFACEPRGEIEVKGIGRVSTYFLTAPQP